MLDRLEASSCDRSVPSPSRAARRTYMHGSSKRPLSPHRIKITHQVAKGGGQLTPGLWIPQLTCSQECTPKPEQQSIQPLMQAPQPALKLCRPSPQLPFTAMRRAEYPPGLLLLALYPTSACVTTFTSFGSHVAPPIDPPFPSLACRAPQPERRGQMMSEQWMTVR